MMHSPERSSSAPKVTIEDLLRVKRAERPPTDFWARFERDLHAKQLAAIIEPRPWWIALRLPQVGKALAFARVPLGAAAVLALSVVVVREYRPFVSAPSQVAVNVAPAAVVHAATKIEALVDTAAVTVLDQAGVQHAEAAIVSQPEAMTAASAVQESASDVVIPSGESEVLMAMIPWAAPAEASAQDAARNAAPSGELPQVHFASAIRPVREHRFEGNMELASLVVSKPEPVIEEAMPVAQLTPVSPREVRRNHILASLVGADSGEGDLSAPGQSREVAASTLDSERLYDSVRRLGMGGDRLTLRF